MTTARLFLGIFAFALLLPLLLLACGGSDEPANGASSERTTAAPTDLPDSERATVEPKGRASSGQTTPEPTTESAEPSATVTPTPAATAAPTMVQTSSETDREALVALYNATGGPDWYISDNWLSDVPISEWEGVTTDGNGHVTELWLDGNELSGEIPPELGNLANLTSLYIQHTQLSGGIPPELGNLANLKHLHLIWNELSGEIPPELGNLVNLESLGLDGNELSGEIPPELGNLVNLESLGLDGNELSGEIPPELGNLVNLESLGLDGNELSGEIPPELGNLVNLESLGLDGNELSGCVPNGLPGRLDMERSDLGDLQFCLAWGEPTKPRPTPVRVAIGFAECIPEDLYHHLLGIDLIENLEDLRAVNYSTRAELGSTYIPEICQTVDVVLTAGEEPKVFNDNVFVLPIPEDLIADQPLDPARYTSRFYEYFDDEFDFLIFVTSLHQFEGQNLAGSNPQYHAVSNGVRGIGRPIFSIAQNRGSGGRLQGLVRLPTYRTMAHQSTVLHELMHRWGAYITGSLHSHWAFSSAHGMVGGFDIADLMDLGGGEFAVRNNWSGGGSFRGSVVYGPIELYVAGFIPPGDVPDLWVGEDVEWVRDQSGEVSLSSGRYRIFKPGTVRIYTIEEIIAEHGERIPDSSRSQKDFRAAVVMLIDGNHPATKRQLDQLSSYVAEFSFPGESRDGKYNFYEATGGRGTIAMGELSDFLKGDSEP